MKLNNHGWGYRDMIISSCILLILLFFAASSISELYDGIEASNAEKEKIRQQWAEKEAEEEKKEEMEEAAKVFVLCVKLSSVEKLLRDKE